MEVAPGVHRIEAPFGERVVCTFLLAGEDRAILVDTGLADTPEMTIAPYLESLGRSFDDLDLVVVSHCDADHSGGNAAVRELGFAGLLACHEADRGQIESVESLLDERYREFVTDGIDFGDEFGDWVRANVRATPVDLGLGGGERLRLGREREVDVLHVPGHSRGHLAFYEPRSRTAVVADAVLGRSVPSVDGAPAIPPTYRHLDAYRRTITKLERLEIKLLLTSHFPALRGGDVRDFLATSRAFADALDDVLLEAFAGAADGLTLAQAVDRVPRALGGWPGDAHALLVFPVAGHLERLTERGTIQPVAGRDLATWRLPSG